MASANDPRRLFLLRHAKTTWSAPDVADHERLLAPRGERTLPGVGLQIDRHLDGPLDLVLGSTAARVQATIAGVLPRLSPPREVHWSRPLYLADDERLLSELRALPDSAQTVLLCGHNPGLQQLAVTLLDDEAPGELLAGLPPAGLVVIDLDDDWAELDVGSGRLVAFSAPPTD
ncbi:MAG: SixA phosphatase family protein [Acidothermaceae bacterium]